MSTERDRAVEIRVSYTKVGVEDRVFEVPTQDELPTVLQEDHPLPNHMKQAFTKYGAYNQKSNYPVPEYIIVQFDDSSNNNMLIYWVEERHEWVGFSQRDQDIKGPYALDDFYATRISGAFGVDPYGNMAIIENYGFSLKGILQMEPERLYYLGQSPQRGEY